MKLVLVTSLWIHTKLRLPVDLGADPFAGSLPYLYCSVMSTSGSLSDSKSSSDRSCSRLESSPSLNSSLLAALVASDPATLAEWLLPPVTLEVLACDTSEPSINHGKLLAQSKAMLISAREADLSFRRPSFPPLAARAYEPSHAA